jgi:hypothetical protein
VTDRPKCALIAIAAMLAVTSSAFAQPAARRSSGQAFVAAARSTATVDRNDPALTGGGSLGYNQTVEHGW